MGNLMGKKVGLFIQAVLVLAVVVLLAGCASSPKIKGHRGEVGSSGTVHSHAEEQAGGRITGQTPSGPTPTPTGTEDEALVAVKREGLDLLKVVIVTHEELRMGAEPLPKDVCKTTLERRFAESGFQVTSAPVRIGPNTSPQQISAIAEQLDADLVVLATAWSIVGDNLQGFYRFKAEGQAKVIKPYSAQIVATSNFTAEGERNFKERQAAEDALEKLAIEMVNYINPNVIQKAVQLVDFIVTIDNLKKRELVERFMEQLSQKRGITFVEVTKWSRETEIGVFRVQLRSVVKERLGYYLEHLKGLRLRVIEEKPGSIKVEVRG